MKKPLIDTVCEHLSDRIHSDELSNDDLVQLIEHVGAYLNLQTVPKYAKEMGISDSGVRRFRDVRTIFGVKFVIDNE